MSKRDFSNGRIGGFGGTMARANRFPEFLVLGCRLGDSPAPPKFRNARGKGWRFFERSVP